VRGARRRSYLERHAFRAIGPSYLDGAHGGAPNGQRAPDRSALGTGSAVSRSRARPPP
jgi:hypothetical protein